MPNLEIRQLMMRKGLKHWQVAKAIGISPYTFSVWLRDELKDERLKRVKDAINSLTGGTLREQPSNPYN